MGLELDQSPVAQGPVPMSLSLSGGLVTRESTVATPRRDVTSVCRSGTETRDGGRGLDDRVGTLERRSRTMCGSEDPPVLPSSTEDVGGTQGEGFRGETRRLDIGTGCPRRTFQPWLIYRTQVGRSELVLTRP